MAGGRPLKFQDVGELQTKIDEYFSTTKEIEWTWTGLAMALDCDKETISMYRDGKGERGEFSVPLKNAMMKVENGYERDLKKFGRTGTIFALKNFDWRDKTEVDQKSENTNINVNANVELDSEDEDVAALVKELETKMRNKHTDVQVSP